MRMNAQASQENADTLTRRMGYNVEIITETALKIQYCTIVVSTVGRGQSKRQYCTIILSTNVTDKPNGNKW